MMQEWISFKYDKEADCWFYFDGKHKLPAFCGECFGLNLGYVLSIPCRLELGKDWYLILGNTDVKLFLNPHETYEVEL